MNIIRYLQGERRGMGSQLKPPNDRQKVTSLFAPSIAIPNIVLLPDVSFYQDAIDFRKMKAAGIDGVIIRAGQRYWVDPKFAINWTNAKAAGLLRGSYWFYDGREDPKKQAALWYQQFKNDPGELVHVPDLEDNYGGAYANKTSRKLFVSEFQNISGLPSKKIAVYTGFYWWQDNMGADSWFRLYRLWLAWYSPEEVVRVPAPWIESDLLLWQYTSSGDGIKYGVTSKEIDLNWYNGDKAKFSAEFGTVSEPEISTGESMRYTFKSNVSTETRTIRNGNGVTFTGVSSLPANGSCVVDFVYSYPVAYTPNLASAGDKWAHIEGTNNWIAVIHQGKTYGILTPLPEPVPQVDLSKLVISGAISMTVTDTGQAVSFTSGPVALNKI